MQYIGNSLLCNDSFKDVVLPKLYECNCIKMGNEIFLFPQNMNALCKINIETGGVELIKGLSGEIFDQYSLFCNVCLDESEKVAVCVSCRAERNHIFDLEAEKEIEDVLIKDNDLCTQSFYNVCCLDKCWYVFPFESGKLQKIDLKKNGVTTTIDVRQQYKKISGCDYRFFSYSGCYIFEKKIYMVMRDTSTIVEYDTYREQIHFYKFEGDSPIYRYAVGYKENLYILGIDGKIYIWNIKNNEVTKKINLSLHEEENERYKHTAKYENYIFVFKYIFSDEYIKIDVETQQAETESLKEMYQIDEQICFVAAEGEILFFLSKEYVLYSINLKAKEAHKKILTFNKLKFQEFIFSHMRELDGKKKAVISEGDYIWTLENYITKHVKTFSQMELSQKETCGAIIYEMMGG